MSLYHPIGKIYSILLLTVILILEFENILLQNKAKIFFASSVFCLIAVFGLGLINSPQFNLVKLPFDTEKDILLHFLESIDYLSYSLSGIFAGTFYVRSFNIPFNVAIFALALAIYKKSDAKGNSVTLVGFCLLGLNLLSIFHFLNNLPGELTSRLLIPLFVFSTGLVTYLFFQIFRRTYSKTIVFSILLITTLFLRAAYSNYRDYFKETEVVKHSESMTFATSQEPLYDANQVRKIFNSSGKCGTIAYFEQTPMWFYSLYGALDCGAIITYVWPTPYKEITDLIEARKNDISYAVVTNRVYNRIGLPYLSANRQYQFSFKHDFNEKFHIRFQTTQESVSIKIEQADGSAKKEEILNIPPASSREVEYSVRNQSEISITTLSGKALLVRATFGPLNWPWSLPVELNVTEQTADPTQPILSNINFETWSKIVNYYIHNKLEVVDDNKAIMLVKVLK